MRKDFDNKLEKCQIEIAELKLEIATVKKMNKRICYNLLGYDVASECEK